MDIEIPIQLYGLLLIEAARTGSAVEEFAIGLIKNEIERDLAQR